VKRLKKEEFEIRIRRLLGRSNSSANVVFETYFPGRRLVGGKYNPSSHTITLYRDTIREQCLQMFGTERYTDVYAAVIFAHELGHAEDHQLADLSAKLDEERLGRREKNKIALKIEQNAWDFACRLLLDWEYAAVLQEIIYQSLEPYYRAVASSYRAAVKPANQQPATA
jgi:hypothetical protein